MNIIKSLNRRYATKSFDPSKKLSDDQLFQLAESLRLAPSSFGLQPWKFLIVNNPVLRTQIRQHAFDQSQITDSSHLIVLCAKEELTDQDTDMYIDTALEQGGNPERLEKYRISLKGSINRMNNTGGVSGYTSNQVYLALGVLLTTCAILQIDACPMGGFDPAGVQSTLGLTGRKPVALCPVGYRIEDDIMANTNKVRYSADQVIEYIN